MFRTILLLVALSACDSEPATKNEPGAATTAEPSAKSPTAQSPTAQTAGHAPSGVVPGSHEDWCGEHAVPESQCTRCDPSLVAAFKATGDWCAEHGLPESQCLVCNPELKIERPPKGS